MATIAAYMRIGALTLGALTGYGNQSKLQGMADSRLLEELDFRAHNPVYYKDADGHYVETTGMVERTYLGYSYAKASHGHH